MRSLLALLFVPAVALASPIGAPTGDLILRFDQEPSPARLQELSALHGVADWEHRRGSFPVYSAHLIDPSEPLRAAHDLAAEVDVRWADADRAVHPVPDEAPVDDPLWDDLWHLENLSQNGDAMPGADIKARQA